MSAYSTVRALYRWADRTLLRRLPDGAQQKVQGALFKLARKAYPRRITARSTSEFSGEAARQQAAAPTELPAWAAADVRAQLGLEPGLAPLVDPQKTVEPYFIPWDMDYVGRRYAQARRELAGPYASMVLLGAGSAYVDPAQLAHLPRPLAIVDVDGDAGLARRAGALEIPYVALPAEHLDSNDHCAVLARLVLQLAPGQMHYAPHPLLLRCVERHGNAMASVTRLTALTLRPEPLAP